MRTLLEEHYNKFNEDKRLTRKHGQVEYITSMKYIHEYLKDIPNSKILDIGAGTGRYSIPLSEEGYQVTAIELVKYNLGILKSKGNKVLAKQGNALNLSKLPESHFDLTLIFGPMYHLYTYEDKLKALTEAKRVTKKDGIIMIAYCMNDYSIITYGFKQNNIKKIIEDKKITEDYQTLSSEENLYSYVRIEEINQLAQDAKLTRLKLISADGHANYMRKELNAMDEETFNLFIDYHLKTCERPELLGAAAHTLDILKK